VPFIVAPGKSSSEPETGWSQWIQVWPCRAQGLQIVWRPLGKLAARDIIQSNS
jgi:hypothetical protein